MDAHNLKDLPRQGIVYVYGAGDGGLMIKRKLERFYAFRISGFVDARQRGELDGCPILQPEQLAATVARDAGIIIASQSYSDIGRFLANAGFSRVVNAFPYMTNHVDDVRYRPLTEVTDREIARLRDSGMDIAGLEAGTLLNDALFRGLMRRASWKCRLVLMDCLVAGSWPSALNDGKLAALIDMVGDFVASVLSDLGRDASGTMEAAVLSALSSDAVDLAQASEWRVANPGRETDINALLMELPALSRLLPFGGRGHCALFGMPAAATAVSATPFHELSYTLHRSHMEATLDDPERELIQASWFDESNANYVLQHRLYGAAVCLRQGGDASWLTVGDGRFGLDALHVSRCGFSSVIASDISDTLLKEAARYGQDIPYQVENAEALSLSSDSVDYVLCKEAYHHFPRPMIALYEMLRVARQGVVLVEPQDPLIDPPVLLDHIERYNYETSGNYVYTVSRREMVKVAAGLNFPAIAFKGINTAYIRGCEFSPASPVSPIFIDLMAQLREKDENCRLGRTKHDILMMVFFKREPTEAVRQALQGDGWDVTGLPRNPFLRPSP